MAQPEKALAKTEDLTLISRTLWQKKRTDSHNLPFDFIDFTHSCPPPPINKYNFLSFKASLGYIVSLRPVWVYETLFQK